MNFAKIKPHAIVIFLFTLISFAYFSPLLEGKRIDGHDIKTWIGMSKEISDFRENTGEEALWTNSLFSRIVFKTFIPFQICFGFR